MCNAGLIPERTADPGRAFHLWSSDGAVILSTNRTDAAGTLAGARDVFGPRLFVCRSPSTMATGTTEGGLTGCGPEAQAGTGDGCVDLQVDSQPHIDGYPEFGNYYPDLVFVLSQRQATAAGQWFLVDGQRLIDAIASDPTCRALSRFLWDVQLEPHRPTGVGPGAAMLPAKGRPVASRTCGGRLTVPYDAFLLLSFGGPEGPEDVLPFLRNVTRGRGVPDERLAGVAGHYHHFGGVSPINRQCRDLLAAIEADFAGNGIDLPAYWGNRNWFPMLADTVAQMRDDGVSSRTA